MGTFEAHRKGDIDAGHPAPCKEESVVMKGVKTVLINKKPVRTELEETQYTLYHHLHQ